MSEPLFARRTATLLGGGLVIGFAVLAFFATLDKRNRSTIETITEPSAAGEPVVFTLPNKGEYDPAAPILKVQEVSYYEDDIVRRPDGAMMKAGHDDSGQYPLYRRYRDDELQEPLHLKLAPEKYLRLSVKPPKKRLESAQEVQEEESPAPSSSSPNEAAPDEAKEE